jgi:hypothetical protein
MMPRKPMRSSPTRILRSQAKAEGGHGYRFFLPALRARAQARRALGIELRRACAEGELELYF